MRGTLLIWIGLMGLAATGGVLLLLRAFPRAFSESGSVVAWPWQRSSGKPARATGWILLAAAIMSVLVAGAGVASLLR